MPGKLLGNLFVSEPVFWIYWTFWMSQLIPSTRNWIVLDMRISEKRCAQSCSQHHGLPETDVSRIFSNYWFFKETQALVDSKFFNPILANVPFLYFLKTSEKQ